MPRIMSARVSFKHHGGERARAGAALSQSARPELRAGLPLQWRLLRADRRALGTGHFEPWSGAVPVGLDQQLTFLRQDGDAARARPADGAATPIFARRRWRSRSARPSSCRTTRTSSGGSSASMRRAQTAQAASARAGLGRAGRPTRPLIMLGFRGFCRETLSAAVMKFHQPERCQRLG